jgi:hypothetical protein
MLARARTPPLVLAQTSVIVVAEIKIAVTQTTVAITARRLILLRCKSLDIHGFVMLGSDTRRIPMDEACLSGNRRSHHSTRQELGCCIGVRASQEEQMWLYRLNREIANIPNMADAFDELGKLAKRDFSPVTAIPDHRV